MIVRLKEYQVEEAYRVYVTDTLYYQAENKKLSVRYYDLIRPKRSDNRSADEIIKETIVKAGLIVLKESEDDNV